MSHPGDQDQSTAAVPVDPTADPAPEARAWDSASPAPTETYPAAPPTYPAADPYGYQAPSFPPAGQYYGQAAPQPGAYHQPGAGHPQPAAPYPPGYPYPVHPYPAPEPPMCGLAVASLVCGIVWVYWITSILAIVFAAVALGKIKREGLRGRGLAIAGLVLGLVWMAFLVIGLLGFLVAGTSSVIPFTG